jgi:hypothetical protein
MKKLKIFFNKIHSLIVMELTVHGATRTEATSLEYKNVVFR